MTEDTILSGFSPAANGGAAVHLAVGTSVEKTSSLLQWTVSRFKGQEIVLVHVHRPSLLIPTLLGKLPASRANPEMVAAFRNEEREETMRLLNTYLMACHRLEVKASIIVTEADKVQKGIMDLVNLHNIRKLVVGTTTDLNKGRKSSFKASHAAKHAPPYCELWFVNKGKLVWTRQASEISAIMLQQIASSDTLNLRSRSLASRENEEETSQTDGTLSWELQYLQNSCHPHCNQSVSSSTSTKSMEEGLCTQLAELQVEGNESKDSAYRELPQQTKLRAEAVEAVNKVKALELALSREVKLRTDAEDILRITIQEQEKLLQEREKITCQLQKTMRSMALLDTRAQEARRRRKEVSEELKLIQASISSLRKEKQKLEVQKIEATRWLDKWRSREHCGDASESKSIGLTEDLSDVPEFSMSDLEAATCNFSECFRIGRGGHGIVYKGEIWNKTVAIKEMHSYNMQRQTDFHKAVQVLGKLRHPNIVELIGVCSESWLLVYEYMPGGSLHNQLSNNNNMSSLNWKIRTRIVADIASALLFLHSFGPEKIVHGNLKPENILLDSENRCKISDCGDQMLVGSQGLRCPSFRHSTGSSGACSYADPESNRTGKVTHKSDIYSFGLIILQLATGKTLRGLVGEVRRAVSNGKMASVLDLSGGEWSTYAARRLLELGLQSCECNSRDRPELTPSLIKELEHLQFLEDQTVPSLFLCPILQELMHDPQVAADGFTYEGDALRGWLGDGHETSPMTNVKLNHLDLTPNHSLRIAIQDWLVNLKITS